MIAYCIIVEECQPGILQIFTQVLRRGGTTEHEVEKLHAINAKIDPVLKEFMEQLGEASKEASMFSGPVSMEGAVIRRVREAREGKKPE